MRCLARFVFFKLMGWRLIGNTDFSKNHIKKAVIIAAPHTSWHDFYIGLLLKSITDVKANFVAKKELFTWPFGWYFRWVGGAPLDRSPGQNKVEAIVKMFNEREEFRLAIAPEGTRKKVANWKTGFYFIAKLAKVPIIMFTLDFGQKQVKISEPFYPSEDMKEDYEYILNFYRDVKGKVAEYS